jgi:sugar/nucleoside kinase (ribokinase family)
MNAKHADIVVVGKPLIDYTVPSGWLREHRLTGRRMSSRMTEEELVGWSDSHPGAFRRLTNSVEVSALEELTKSQHGQLGGSALLSAVSAAERGVDVAFWGAIGHDATGRRMRDQLKKVGVNPELAMKGRHTGTCLVTVHDDGDRTMVTSPAAAGFLEPYDLDTSFVESLAHAKALFIESFLFNSPSNTKAFQRAIQLTGYFSGDKKIAMALSDVSCVRSHTPKILDALKGAVNVCIGDQHQICALMGTDDPSRAATQLAELCPTVVTTLGSRGSFIVTRTHEGQKVLEFPSIRMPNDIVLNTNGAGDAFAGGFLSALATGLPVSDCGQIATRVAAERIISKSTPRIANDTDQHEMWATQRTSTDSHPGAHEFGSF